MKKGWEIKKLKDICEKITDGTHQTPKYFASGYIFLSSKNVTSGKIDWDNVKYIDEEQHSLMRKRVSPKKGDILLAKNGTTGVAAIVDRDVVFDIYVSLAWLRSKGEILPQYLLYFINSPIAKHQFNKRLKGIGVPNLHLQEIREVEIYYPKSFGEQQRIVSVLDECFAAIDKAKANAEKNLKNAKELYKCYLQGIFKKRGDDWEEMRFDEVCILQRGFDLPTHSRFAGEYPLVSSNGITDRINQWRVRAPGVVTGRSGTIGNVHFIEEDYWPLNTALYIKDFYGNYERCVYYFLLQFDLSKYSSGAGVPTLNRNNVHCEKVWFPRSAEVQKTIVEQLDNVRTETQKLETIYQKKIANLEELKKSILQKAFAGELTSKQTEKAVAI